MVLKKGGRLNEMMWRLKGTRAHRVPENFESLTTKNRCQIFLTIQFLLIEIQYDITMQIDQ